MSSSTSTSDINASDALYLFESLRYSTTPIVVNVASIAQARGPGTKPNTICKRLGGIKKKYGLNIVCTTVGGGDGVNVSTGASTGTGTAAVTHSSNGSGTVKVSRNKKANKKTSTTTTTTTADTNKIHHKVQSGRITKRAIARRRMEGKDHQYGDNHNHNEDENDNDNDEEGMQVKKEYFGDDDEELFVEGI
ncbi:hypothetical protein UCRPC4_g05383 [Phaeomoniella chlamydospora]|uniref:Uncharacterized protein n=1 Tax=Phaeomoniella chlamydospora TaxID=158046 RepID=A0A0G2GLG7_PHACM|nr:hypothetical protein UCRPC4_g05383 [Phaeomoniella chlamydospora]